MEVEAAVEGEVRKEALEGNVGESAWLDLGDEDEDDDDTDDTARGDVRVGRWRGWIEPDGSGMPVVCWLADESRGRSSGWFMQVGTNVGGAGGGGVSPTET